MTPWEIQGTELVNCNCAYGCPCQFNEAPTHGHCEANAAISVDKGHFGDVTLDGLRVAAVFSWPGAIHEGHGKCQPVVDVKASPAQREALLKIMSGQDTQPFATMFSVFASTMEIFYEPIFTTIDFDVDVNARRGKVHVDGVFDLEGQPIRNPVNGQEHRARIDLPNGFEFEVAEIASGTSQSRGKLSLDLVNSHAHFANLHMNNQGVVRHHAGL